MSLPQTQYPDSKYNQYLLLLFNAVCLANNQQVSNS
jgi:hypothetical protein